MNVKGTLLQGIRHGDSAALAEYLLGKGLDVRMTVTGLSMAPTIKSGDTVVLQSTDSLPYTGDIVFYRNDTGQAVLHRAVGFERNADGEQMFYTMGDALSTLEGPFPEGAVMGRAITIGHAGGMRHLPDTALPLARTVAYFRAWLLRCRLFFVSVRRLGKALVGRKTRTVS